MPMEPRLASQEIGKTCVVSRQIWSNLGTKSRHRRVACSCSCSSLEPRKDKQKQQKARRWCEAKDMSRLCLIQKPSQVTVCLWQSGKNFMLKGSGNNIHSAWCNEWEKLTLVIQASVQTIYQICKWLCVPIYFVMLLILIMGYLNLKDFKVNSCIYLYCRVEFHYQIGLIHFILKFQPSKQLCCGYLWIIWLKSLPSPTTQTAWPQIPKTKTGVNFPCWSTWYHSISEYPTEWTTILLYSRCMTMMWHLILGYLLTWQYFILDRLVSPQAIFISALVRRPILPISSLVPAERGGSLQRSTDLKTLKGCKHHTYVLTWFVFVSLPPLKSWHALIASFYIETMSAPNIWQHAWKVLGKHCWMSELSWLLVCMSELAGVGMC